MVVRRRVGSPSRRTSSSNVHGRPTTGTSAQCAGMDSPSRRSSAASGGGKSTASGACPWPPLTWRTRVPESDSPTSSTYAEVSVVTSQRPGPEDRPRPFARQSSRSPTDRALTRQDQRRRGHDRAGVLHAVVAAEPRIVSHVEHQFVLAVAAVEVAARRLWLWLFVGHGRSPPERFSFHAAGRVRHPPDRGRSPVDRHVLGLGRNDEARPVQLDGPLNMRAGG